MCYVYGARTIFVPKLLGTPALKYLHRRTLCISLSCQPNSSQPTSSFPAFVVGGTTSRTAVGKSVPLTIYPPRYSTRTCAYCGSTEKGSSYLVSLNSPDHLSS